ncbi:MAG: c-type cytochrome [Desulfobaccales bacterium]
MRKPVLWAMAGVFLGATVLVAPQGAWAQDGKQIYEAKCVACHGENGDGKGALCKNFNPPPSNFTDPTFWQGDVNKKIADAITQGKKPMLPIKPALTPDEIKAVTDYMTQSFKK